VKVFMRAVAEPMPFASELLPELSSVSGAHVQTGVRGGIGGPLLKRISDVKGVGSGVDLGGGDGIHVDLREEGDL
jgi:hypothetical protein